MALIFSTDNCGKEQVMDNEKSMTVLIDSIDKVKSVVHTALLLPFQVDVVSGRYRIDSKSLLGLLSLDLSKPVELRFPDEGEVLARMSFQSFEVRE